jgi:hypothetical protein
MKKEEELTPLKRLTTMARIAARYEEAVEGKDAEMKALKKKLLNLHQVDLPELMDELELVEITVRDEDGSALRLTSERKYDSKITDGTRDAALRWLTENGFGGLIKTELVLSFDRDHRDEAGAIASRLREESPEGAMALKETVHAGTLKAFVAERLQANESVPFDLFNIHTYSMVKPKKG